MKIFQKSLLVFLVSILAGPQLGCVNEFETGSLESEIYVVGADAGFSSEEEDDGESTTDEGGGEEVVCVLDDMGVYSGDDCLDGKCEGKTLSGEDTCGDLEALPSCEYLREHNASVEKYAGGKFMEFVPTNVAAFGHYETEYTRKTIKKQVLEIGSTSVTVASLAVDRTNAVNLKICVSTGTCAVDPLKVASPLGKKIASGLSVAGKAASAVGAVLYAYEVARDLNDSSCSVVTQKWHKVLEAEAKTVFTSACAEDGEDEVQCNVCGDTEAQTGSEEVKSLDLAFKGELWKDEDMVNKPCKANWVALSECGKRESEGGFCMRASCGSGTPSTHWVSWPDVWNVLQAYEWARIAACAAWAKEIESQY